MSPTILMNALQLGLVFAVLSIGEYITVNIMDSPDLTVDGSFVSGAAVCAMMTLAGMPNLGLLCSMLIGALCGCVTVFFTNKNRK
ncbi:ABC transporter, permease protein, partial [gut metagenome]